jgi:hypothetical protein
MNHQVVHLVKIGNLFGIHKELCILFYTYF